MRRTATPLFLLLALGALAATDATACPGSSQACAAPSGKSASAAHSTPSACTASMAHASGSCAAPSSQAATAGMSAGSSCCGAAKGARNTTATRVKAKKAKVARPAAKSATAAKPAPAPVAPATPVAAATAGMRAYLDPESGVIGGMPVGGDETLGGGAAAAGVPVQVTLPDGSVMLQLNGALDDFLVLTVGPDGRRTLTCSKAQDPAHVHAAPDPAPAADAPKVEER